MPSDAAVLSSSFRYPDRRFLWGRMKLFEDRIEFAGLGWTGMHRRTVPLSRVRDLRWWTGEHDINFALLLTGSEAEGEDSKERIYVRVDAAGLWKHEVEARAENLKPDEAALPQTTPQRARAA